MSEQRKTFDIAIITGIVAALIAFLGNIVVTYIQGRNQLRLERSQHESALVTKAITVDLQTTTKMLQFYLDAGLLSDENGKNREVHPKPGKYTNPAFHWCHRLLLA